MNSIVIRLAKSEDLKAVQDLNYELFVSDARHYKDLNVQWPYEAEGKQYFAKRIKGKCGVCFVAELDDKIVGYVAGGWHHTMNLAYKGKRAELENICVTADVRSSGIGAELVTALKTWCKQQDAVHLLVDAYTLNTKALDFYAQQGFGPYSTVLWQKL